ncbi:hypothetical protein FQZ97_902550 [compost metagenome]
MHQIARAVVQDGVDLRQDRCPRRLTRRLVDLPHQAVTDRPRIQQVTGDGFAGVVLQQRREQLLRLVRGQHRRHLAGRGTPIIRAAAAP